MRAKLVKSKQIMPGVSTFWFKPEHPLRFEPGQFVAITIPHKNMDERGDMREISISSSPNEALITITSSYVAQNGSSYKKALLALRPGENVNFGEPMGDFVLPKDTSIPLVFVAAGIGSTPYASIIKWLLETGERRNIKLINSVTEPEGFLFEDLWANYKLNFTPIVTKPSVGWKGSTGRLTAQRVSEMAQPIENKLIYLAGPQTFIEPMFNELLEMKVPRYQLLLDYFPGY